LIHQNKRTVLGIKTLKQIKKRTNSFRPDAHLRFFNVCSTQLNCVYSTPQTRHPQRRRALKKRKYASSLKYNFNIKIHKNVTQIKYLELKHK